MDMIKMLPKEIENKIFYMIAEHPLATIFKKHITVDEETDEYIYIGIKYEKRTRWQTVKLKEDVTKSIELDR